ncbi:Cof subfamily protein (haloacid dehalogenase superfamily) [Aeromonas sp. BIGb0405]|jgi:Cof subfamily protein (haloacid dehalogenase superfamily)|uniref:Cof-type HAD-IIB family hydrolase n=1 Tax=Aeromonas TaxID=642 RepID=UPI001CC9E263|nr:MULTISPECIES: Cof-type HAD-IIB family hydrolase [Aeromonas]MCS3457432.1 Cof subfamily protein (haloacid dehalogenase superfamily) [Aeromonas sp. BIGb0405]MCS3461409.1 Cof subfamily protein (haloacid dehalogenase superfamily) [Aeromonas sp. BIGb0445]UBO74707.1 Cof-type HAD-IIB family hydrolase [Aeromonas rivuli]
MTQYRAIALDMDGTLLTRDHQISSATRQALADARAQGIKVLLVTGRHFMTARPFHHELGLDTPIICSNGAYLYDPLGDRILSGDPLANEPLATLLAAMAEEQVEALAHLSQGIGHLGCEPYVTRVRSWSASVEEQHRVQFLPQSSAQLLAQPEVWKLELFSQEPAHLHDFASRVIEGLPFTQDWAAPYAVELVKPGCSKGNRLAQWAAGEGIAMSEVVAFGDNNNDISMFEQVGLAVAMGNAAPQIQGLAHKVTADHNEDGIALGLARWVL